MSSIEYICLGSGSSGNCYALKKDNEVVLLEVGLDIKTITLKLIERNISLKDIKAVIVSHKHSDHSKALKYFIDRDYMCYVPETYFSNDENKTQSNVIILKDKAHYTITNWLKCYSFSVLHDVECFGFALMDSDSRESTLFITDTKMFDFELYDICFDAIFIECNHIRKQLEVIMQQALDNGDEGAVFKYKRQSAYHLSLAGVKKFLNKMNLSKTKAIFLIHLSKECCNDVLVKTEIKNVYKIPTYVCYANGNIN